MESLKEVDVPEKPHFDSSSGSSLANNESVQVIVRSRPMSINELNAKCTDVVAVYPERGVIEVQNPKARSENEKYKIFTYDGVYDSRYTQQNLYDEIVRPLVCSVLEGYNGCVFAYGQTGTGKTYTMEGVPGTEEAGIIPRVFEQIWTHINRTNGVEFLVVVNYLEIYMEEIRDLLKIKHSKPLEIRENPGQGVYVTHLHSHTCKSATDMQKAMRTGNKNRTTGATNMNEHSSRSHAIFQIVVEMAEADKKGVKVGKLNLIDLAGSERQSKTGATGDRLKEATKINKALSALGNVIYALAESSAHVPYRDSKLTRLLQDSLGGNSKTIMIANVGPASSNYEETIITLRYAHRAKAIKNTPIKNEDIQNTRLLELQTEIERLKSLIMARSGALPEENQENEVDLDEGQGNSGSEGEDERVGVVVPGRKKENDKHLEETKMQVSELGKKLKMLERQTVHGGKDVVDSVSENQLRLEESQAEIAARKKREVEMQQRIELEEENCLELKQVFANLQQEVDFKRGKLKRLYAKLQSLRQEIKDIHEEYLQKREEIEDATEEATKQLRKMFLIIDNFVPTEERTRLINMAHFDEDLDDWVIRKEKKRPLPRERLVINNYRRPVTEYALDKDGLRYRGENVLDLPLDMALRTTQEYKVPSVCPQVKAAVQNIIRSDMNNNSIVVKIAPHGFPSKSVSKAELENRFNKAARYTTEVYK